MNIIPARNEELEGGATLYSHPSFATPGKVYVRVIDFGIEIAAEDDSRGQAIEQLADHLLELSRQLRRAAWAPNVNDP
jgi:hypothetical protein